MKKKEKKTKKKTTKKTKGNKKIISRLINILSIIALGFFLWYAYKINIIPMKYYKIGAIVLIALELIYTLLCVNKKKTGKLLIFLDIIAIILIVGEFFGYKYLKETEEFLRKNFEKNYTYDEYYLITNKASTIKKVKDIKGSNIFFYVDTDYYAEIKTELKKQTNAKIEEEESLANALLKLDTPENVILINSGDLDTLCANDEMFNENIKEIGSIRIIVKKEEEKTPDIDITNTPFIIFLSGIDTRGDTLVKKSLSDVNMLITVNPNTRTILLVSIPRDSYVPIHGYNGRKDKLTHAGSLGGLEMSKATVEDLMGYEAQYYARVNFRAVISLVDAVGGVEVEEDAQGVDSRFNLWTNRTCWINPGTNYLNGECALAFARERYHYYDGDMQRNRNQQKVLKALFNKIANSSYMVRHYDDLLKAVDGTFETNMPIEDIKKLINFQLTNMPHWQFESQNVVGGTGRTTTLSSGSTELSVVYPNQNSINEAKEAIRKVLAGESLHPEETVTE